jgi:hypothetical protein
MDMTLDQRFQRRLQLVSDKIIPFDEDDEKQPQPPCHTDADDIATPWERAFTESFQI